MTTTIDQRPSRVRSGLVLAIEGALFLLVVASVVYFVTVGLNDARSYSSRLFAWWAAGILTAMSLWPLLRRRIVSGSWRRGHSRHRALLEGDVGAVMWLQMVLYGGLAITWAFAFLHFWKAKTGARNPEDLWLSIFIMVMITWPGFRFRIINGYWKPSPYSRR